MKKKQQQQQDFTVLYLLNHAKACVQLSRRGHHLPLYVIAAIKEILKRWTFSLPESRARKLLLQMPKAVSFYQLASSYSNLKLFFFVFLYFHSI